MENNSTASTKKRISYFICAALFAFGIGIVSFYPISSNKVSASSTDFIKNNPYVVSISSVLYCTEQSYDPNGYNFLQGGNSFGSHYLAFDPTNASSGLSLLPSYYYKLLDNNTFEEKEAFFNSAHNSQRYRFNSLNNELFPYFSVFYSERDDFYSDFSYDFIKCVDIQININKAYPITSGFENWFNKLNCARYYLYQSSNQTTKLNIVFAENMDSFDTVPLMSIYYTFDTTTPLNFTSGYYYETDVVRIDRSSYIDKEIIYTNPIDDLFLTIRQGVSNMLDITVFPNFTLGSVLALILGVSCVTFLLHIIVK